MTQDTGRGTEQAGFVGEGQVAATLDNVVDTVEGGVGIADGPQRLGETGPGETSVLQPPVGRMHSKASMPKGLKLTSRLHRAVVANHYALAELLTEGPSGQHAKPLADISVPVAYALWSICFDVTA
jgi:hypothetical protein